MPDSTRDETASPSRGAEEPDAPDSVDQPRATPAPKPADTAGRRPNPAASAASRARRIGGSTGTHRAAPAPAEDAAHTAAHTAASGAAQATARDATHSDAAGPDTAGGGTRRRWSRKSTTAATAASDSTDAPSTDTPSTDTAGSSTRTRRLRATSARELKDEASAPTTVTEVPAWLRWVPAIVLSGCAVVMIVIIAVSAHGVWYAKPSTSAARDQVLAAAKKCTATANTYNYKTLAADEKRGLACTTGAWTAQYRSALEKIVKPTAIQLKASQTVQVNSAGVESVTGNGDQWTTIVYGQLTINQAGATPRVDQFAAVVQMDKVKSTYLVGKIDLVTNPSA